MSLSNGAAVPVPLAVARAALELACDDLDDAVRALADVQGATVMASPGLVALLLRVVAARREMKGLEALNDAEHPWKGMRPS
jgi:hypothetical protein